MKRFDSVVSTQDEAKLSGLPGDIFVSLEQTGGRGKPGSSWFSPPGGLYFSVVLKADTEVRDLLPLTGLAAKAVVSLLKEHGIEGSVKPPNDVMVNGKKICGILTEKSAGKLVVGFGLNTNIGRFTPGLDGVSMSGLLNREVDNNGLLDRLLDILNKEYSLFSGNIV